MKNRKSIVAMMVVLLSLWLAGSAWAHAAIVWAYFEGGQVYVEAFYASGAKIQKAKVVVLNKEGKTIVEGQTDTEGKYAYTPHSKETQKVVVVAGESHVGDFELTPDDFVEVQEK